MYLRTNRTIGSVISRYAVSNKKFLATQVDIKDNEIQNALPYEDMPGPSKLSFLLANLPGGRYHGHSLTELISALRTDYGDLARIPGMFGLPEVIFTYNPEHFQKLFRTEGVWPNRLGLDTMQYYRTKLRPEIFGNHKGLINSQGKDWGDFRSAVNPVMMNPKTTKLYVPTIDLIVTDFVKRIRDIRNPSTMQLPENFEDDLNRWSLESIGAIALDTRLGLISDKYNEKASILIGALKSIFELTVDLDIKPSIWKIVKTPKFKKLMKAYDSVTDISRDYIQEAKKRIESMPEKAQKDREESIIEKLLKIDPIIAQVMAMDMFFAAVDANNDVQNALPYEDMPGPSKLSFLLANLPGGRYYGYSFTELMTALRADYGDLARMPGMFGHPEIIFTYNPEHFQTLFRTEGVWPNRLGLDTMQYYRTKLRRELFGKHQGLINSQGKEWGDFRSAVNPVMMQPKTAKLYVPTIDSIATDFIKRIRDIRNPSTMQLPENFEDELNRWALESIGAIALDTRLGLISGKYNEKASKLIEAIKSTFELSLDLDIKPSIWKIVKTPKFKQLMKAYDTITDISRDYIQEAKKRIESMPERTQKDREESVLEKLLKIDPIIAQVMAMDMFFAGVDTTSSGFVGLLYMLANNPDKQETLRQEILTILPEQDTPLTTEKMSRMPYLRACIKEAIRLCPVAPGNVRATGQDMVLDGYVIPKGKYFFMPGIVLQKEERHFSKADQFIPERWLRDQSGENCPVAAKSAHPFIYMPFGFGPRMCIGRRLAEMEIEILTSRIVRNFSVKWEHPDLKFKSTTLIAPDGELMFTLTDI